MSELIILLIAAAVGLGGIIWFYNKDKGPDLDKDGDVDLQDLDIAINNAKEGIEEDVREVVEEVAETVKEAVKKLPTKSKLQAMKKAAIEELAREFGVELDKRKTKDNMIADLQKEVKKQK